MKFSIFYTRSVQYFIIYLLALSKFNNQNPNFICASTIYWQKLVVKTLETAFKLFVDIKIAKVVYLRWQWLIKIFEALKNEK